MCTCVGRGEEGLACARVWGGVGRVWHVHVCGEGWGGFGMCTCVARGGEGLACARVGGGVGRVWHVHICGEGWGCDMAQCDCDAILEMQCTACACTRCHPCTRGFVHPNHIAD